MAHKSSNAMRPARQNPEMLSDVYWKERMPEYSSDAAPSVGARDGTGSKMNSSSELAGIGVLVQRLGGLITVVDLVEGGPAHLSGQLRIGQVLRVYLTSHKPCEFFGGRWLVAPTLEPSPLDLVMSLLVCTAVGRSCMRSVMPMGRSPRARAGGVGGGWASC